MLFRLTTTGHGGFPAQLYHVRALATRSSRHCVPAGRSGISRSGTQSSC